MTAKERVEDILKRCWEKDLQKREAYPFFGLDVEIEKAVLDAEAQERERCARVAEDQGKCEQTHLAKIVCATIAEAIREQ